MNGQGLSDDQRLRLDQLFAEARWRYGRELRPDALPDVAYGSPEYHEFLKTIPKGSERGTVLGSTPSVAQADRSGALATCGAISAPSQRLACCDA